MQYIVLKMTSEIELLIPLVPKKHVIRTCRLPWVDCHALQRSIQTKSFLNDVSLVGCPTPGHFRLVQNLSWVLSLAWQLKLLFQLSHQFTGCGLVRIQWPYNQFHHQQEFPPCFSKLGREWRLFAELARRTGWTLWFGLWVELWQKSASAMRRESSLDRCGERWQVEGVMMADGSRKHNGNTCWSWMQEDQTSHFPVERSQSSFNRTRIYQNDQFGHRLNFATNTIPATLNRRTFPDVSSIAVGPGTGRPPLTSEHEQNGRRAFRRPMFGCVKRAPGAMTHRHMLLACFSLYVSPT